MKGGLNEGAVVEGHQEKRSLENINMRVASHQARSCDARTQIDNYDLKEARAVDGRSLGRNDEHNVDEYDGKRSSRRRLSLSIMIVQPLSS